MTNWWNPQKEQWEPDYSPDRKRAEIVIAEIEAAKWIPEFEDIDKFWFREMGILI